MLELYALYLTAPTVCNNGDILLYNGTTLSADFSGGTVLVCLDNVYGTVCDDFWDTLDASVVCSWLGFNPTGMKSSVIYLCIKLCFRL